MYKYNKLFILSISIYHIKTPPLSLFTGRIFSEILKTIIKALITFVAMMISMVS